MIAFQANQSALAMRVQTWVRVLRWEAGSELGLQSPSFLWAHELSLYQGVDLAEADL